MPWGIAAGVVGSVAGSAISSAMAPSPSASGGGSGLYTPSGLGPADQSWQQLLQNQTSAYNGGQNPYSSALLNNAQYAGNMYGNLANYGTQVQADLGQQAQADYGSQKYLQGAGQQVYNLAMDPQSALYNRTQQQLGDQVNAQQALRGLGNSAVGASEANQAYSNFNIDWQNNQLSRATQGLGALNSAYNTAGSYGQLGNADLNGVLSTGAQAAGYQAQAGSAPYDAYNAMQGNQIGQASQIQGQIIPYLNYGQGATSNAYNAASQNAQNMGATAAQGIGSLGQNFGSLFGGGSGGYGGNSSLFGASGDMSGLAGSYGSTTNLGSAASLGNVSSTFY